MRVLVCDDDRECAQATGALLTFQAQVPLTLDLCFDGQQAVDKAIETHPDVVVLDLEMPGLDGFETAAAIKVALVDAPALLIAISGAAAYVKAAEAGGTFDHALLKPVDCYALSRLVFGV